MIELFSQLFSVFTLDDHLIAAFALCTGFKTT
jgi:hypothetical protein